MGNFFDDAPDDMPTNIIDINEGLPHTVDELICVKCLKRWISVRPVSCMLMDLKCPGCFETGYVILTGETGEL